MADVIEGDGDSCAIVDTVPELLASRSASVNPNVSINPRSREASILQSLPPSPARSTRSCEGSPARSPITTDSQSPEYPLGIAIANLVSDTLLPSSLEVPAHPSASTEQLSVTPLAQQQSFLSPSIVEANHGSESANHQPLEPDISSTTPAQQVLPVTCPLPSKLQTVANYDSESANHQPEPNLSPAHQASPVACPPPSGVGTTSNDGFELTNHQAPPEPDISSTAFIQQPLTAGRGRVNDSSSSPMRTRRSKGGTSDAPITPSLSSIPSKRKNTDAANATPSKRTRKAAVEESADAMAPSPPSAPVISSSTREEAPKWFLDVTEMFRSENLGEEWKKLVDEWKCFETEQGFVEVMNLSSKGRPEAVKMWIARRRSTTWRPEISNVNDYATQFQAWWLNLQPDWRVVNDTVQKHSVVGNWDCLQLPGLNGLQSVLAALFYWGIAARKKPAHRKIWISIVEDCFIAISNVRR
jgi:hypothetical protein